MWKYSNATNEQMRLKQKRNKKNPLEKKNWVGSKEVECSWKAPIFAMYRTLLTAMVFTQVDIQSYWHCVN